MEFSLKYFPILIVLSFIIQVRTQSTQQSVNTRISCPTLECAGSIDPNIDDHNVCFKTDASLPIRKLKGYKCEMFQEIEQDLKGAVMCDFDLLSQQYVWENELTQNISFSNNTFDSQLYKRKNQAYCREVAAYASQNLNNGRDCSESGQCLSHNCDSGKCKGLEQGEMCHQHSDCDDSLYCTINTDVSKCAKLKTSYEVCNETEECSIAHYCWFANLQDRRDSFRKQCLPLYSQDEGTFFGWYSANWNQPTYQDYQINGKYCKSGLAFPVNEFQANCTAVNMVKHSNQEIQKPYSCNPTDNNVTCRLYFNTSLDNNGSHGLYGIDYFEVACSCALDGDNGYCSSLLGTQTYADASTTLKALLEQSNCHTLDRNDFRAQKDECGVGNNDEWKKAVEDQFQLKYWPYTQSDKVYSCVKTFFQDSYDNLAKSTAFLLQSISLLTYISLFFLISQ